MELKKKESPDSCIGHMARVHGPCPHCGCEKGECYELVDYNIYFMDGKIICSNTGGFIRWYDAGG